MLSILAMVSATIDERTESALVNLSEDPETRAILRKRLAGTLSVFLQEQLSNLPNTEAISCGFVQIVPFGRSEEEHE